MWIFLLINENGLGIVSPYCFCKSLKLIDFWSILGGVLVLSLLIENPMDSMVLALLTVGLSSDLPAG